MSFRSIASINPGRSRAVFLEPVSVEGLRQDDIPVLKERVHNIMEKKLREYKNFLF